MGSTYQRKDGRWVAAISMGSRGQRSVLTRYARTEDEAEAHLDELRKLTKPEPSTGRMTVGRYLEEWLRTAGKRSLKASTLRTYEVALRRHIAPAIGNVTLAHLTPEQVDAMLADMDLSPKGQRNVLGFLSRVLAVAQARGYVLRNAARLVEPPRVHHDEPAALTAAEAKRILGAARGDRLEALWVLALATGLRQAELLGLRWSDVNLDGGSLRVELVLVRTPGRRGAKAGTKGAGWYDMDTPKTPKSRRTVALPPFAVQALRDHRTRQVAERLAAGRETKEGLVFVSEHDGRPLNGGWISHRWPVIARKAEVDVTFHGLRHGQTSLLVAAGTHPRVIAGRLGHSTIAQTMDRYAHVVEASDRAAAQALQEAIG